MYFNNYKRLVVQRTGAMGDVVWTTPLFKFIRDQGFTGELVAATHYPEVFRNNPHVSVVCVPEDLQWYLDFDEEVLLDLDWAYESDRQQHKHLLQAYCEKLHVYWKAVSSQPLLYPSPNDYKCASATCVDVWKDSKGVVVIHAAATSPDRIWSCLRWEKLTDYLLSDEFSVICVGSANDYHLQPRAGVADLIGKTSLLQTTALISAATAFVGSDSGVANLAFSTQAPSLVLYGMAHPASRLPQNSTKHFGITAHACSCIGCIEKLAVKAPPLCHERPRAMCMDLISVTDVIDALQEIL